MSFTAPTLTDVVAERVAHKTGRRVRNLTVEVDLAGGSRVVLRGRAASYHVKQLAQQAVREVLPAAKVENAIVVE